MTNRRASLHAAGITAHLHLAHTISHLTGKRSLFFVVPVSLDRDGNLALLAGDDAGGRILHWNRRRRLSSAFARAVAFICALKISPTLVVMIWRRL